MRFIIDTELERVIVPDSYYNQLDKTNKLIEANGGTKIDYVQFVKDAYEKAIKNPLIRKADIPRIKK